uniref:Uncharacterized protein n=1 Tax=Arundo donax TaxID=35708 RepID=A0A0A8YYR9_ARUDO
MLLVPRIQAAPAPTMKKLAGRPAAAPTGGRVTRPERR